MKYNPIYGGSDAAFVKAFDARYNCKTIDPAEGIIEINGKCWRPTRNKMEEAAIACDDEQTLSFASILWVGVEWKPLKKSAEKK